MKGSELHMMHEYGKGWNLAIHVSEEAVGLAKMLCDKYKDGFVDVQVEKWSDKRSLQANAYFHVLCNKIAEATKSSMDDVKKMLVTQYGTLARGSDGKLAGAILPPNTKVEDFYPYYKWYGTTEQGFNQYLFFKQTHTLTKDEMNRLIQGTVDEAKALNIETLTPAEIERMVGKWQGVTSATE